MYTDRLPQIPTADQLDEQGKRFGRLILATTWRHEHQDIVDYGTKLLAGATPTSGQTTRFFACLAHLSANLPGYRGVIAHASMRPADISRFQQTIARTVARHYAAQGGCE